MHDAMLSPVQERQALCPGCGDVGQRERVQERAFKTATAMGDKVGLQKSRFDVGPLGERAHWDLVLQQSPRPGGRETMRMAHRPQHAVDRGWTQRQQLVSDFVGES